MNILLTQRNVVYFSVFLKPADRILYIHQRQICFVITQKIINVCIVHEWLLNKEFNYFCMIMS